MAIDSNIPLQAKTFTLSDLLNDQQQRDAHAQAMQIQQQQASRQQAEFARQQQQWRTADTSLASQRQAIAAASGGDYAGADKQYGAGAGDLDIHKVIAGLQDEHRAQVASRIKSAVPVAIQALQTTDPQARAALIHAAAPSLIEAGWKPEEIAAFQPTDEALKGLIEQSRTADEALKLYDARNKPQEPFTLGQDQVRYDANGKEIARGPESIKAITTPEGGTTTVYGGAGHTGIGGGQQYTGGWTPRARNGGDNTDAAVDGKISGAAQFLGVSPSADIRGLSPMKIAQAMTLSEGGAGSLADRNNNPANIKNADGSFKQFPTKAAGLAAAAALVQRKLARGQTTVQSLIEGLPAKGGGPVTIHGAPKPEDSAPLTPEAIDYVAQQYAATGQMPPLGMGKQAAAMRAQIIGRAAVLAKQQGISGTEAVGVHADTKANTAALVTLQRTANQVLAYESTANANADQVLQTMGKGAAGSGVPVINAWIQHGRNGYGGSPDVAKFNLAVQTFATEYARVVSGATGGAVTSDSARHEMMGLINNAQTPDQLRAVIQQARTEMGNRKQGLAQQADALRSQLRGGGQSSAQTPWYGGGGRQGGKPTVSNW